MVKTTTVLGISFSTRAAGFAVLTNGKLLDWHIKAFKECWSARKPTVIIQTIERILAEHAVQCIAIKLQPSYATNKEISMVLKKLQERCAKRAIVVYAYSTETLRHSQPIPITSKQELMRYLVMEYPCLQSLYQKEITNRNPYHIKVFEAVLAARYCHQTVLV